MLTLDTARLALRPLVVEDAPHFVGLFENDWDAIKQTGRMPYPVTESAMRDWIALHAAAASRTFLMIRREDGAALGGVGFGGAGDVQELGYALGRRYWGQGYALEVARAWLQWFDTNKPGTHLFADVHPAHSRSQNVLQKLGFRPSHTEVVYGMTMWIYERATS